MSSDYTNKDVLILINFVRGLAQSDKSEEDLQKASEITPENSYGNYDDCFSDGAYSAEAFIAQEARRVLELIESGIQKSEQKIKLKEKIYGA